MNHLQFLKFYIVSLRVCQYLAQLFILPQLFFRNKSMIKSILRSQTSTKNLIIKSFANFSQCKNCSVRSQFKERVKHILKRNKGQIHQMINRQNVQFAIQLLEAYHFVEFSKLNIAMPALQKILGNTKDMILEEDFKRVQKIFDQLKVSLPSSFQNKVVANKNVIEFQNGSTVTMVSPNCQTRISQHYDLYFFPREFQVNKQNPMDPNFKIALIGKMIEEYFKPYLSETNIVFSEGKPYSVPPTLPPNLRRDYQQVIDFVKHFNPKNPSQNIQIQLLGIPLIFVVMLQFKDCSQQQLNRALKGFSYGNFLGAIRLINKYEDLCNIDKLKAQQSHHYWWNFVSKTKLLPNRVQTQHQASLIHKAAMKEKNKKIFALVQQRFYLEVLSNVRALQRGDYFPLLQEQFQQLMNEVAMTEETVVKMLTINAVYQTKGDIQKLLNTIKDQEMKKSMMEIYEQCINAKTIKPLVSDPQILKWDQLAVEQCPLISLNMMRESKLRNFEKISKLDNKKKIIQEFNEKIGK